MLRQSQQGYLHYRFFDPRWWCQGSQNQNKELDLHHFLRSRRHLRCHHVHGPQDLAATTTLVSPCSGLVCWSALATWSVVFLLVSTVAVLRSPMLLILACKLLLAPRIYLF
jgi:hypothetical protein